ncbi:MAG: CBS domain-containing protein [Saprospiraceae bacterium]
MIAGNLISNIIIPLRTSDTGDDALGVMSDFYVKHLPIVNNEQLLGTISEDDILENDVEEAVGSYSLSMHRPYVKENDHIYEVMRIMAEYNLTVIPVVDFDDNYKGLIAQDDLLRYFANTGSFKEPGSIIVLEMGKRDYSLSEISRIVESEGAAILSSFITTSLDSTQVDVTVKVNRQNIQSIIATLQRFEYDIKASFNEVEYLESLQERYDALMSYLNV